MMYLFNSVIDAVVCCGLRTGEDFKNQPVTFQAPPQVEEASIEKLESKLKGFTVTLHSATLIKSFKRHGSFRVYALIYRDGTQACKPGACRTAPIESRSPEWEHKHVFSKVPNSISISLWAEKKGWAQGDLLIGSVTLPCSPDMRLEKEQFQVEKKGKITASVLVTIHGEFEQTDSPIKPDALVKAHARKLTSLLGGEFDDLIANLHDGTLRVVATASSTATALTFRVMGGLSPRKSWTGISFFPTEEDEVLLREDLETSPPSSENLQGLARARSNPAPDFNAHAILGCWECTATEGLDDFLYKSGVGMFQRKIAIAARWPMWEFAVDEHTVIFNNHSAIGLMEEKFTIGKSYAWIDGKGNEWCCEATWAKNPTGGTLTIERRGALGDYKEMRIIDGETMEFTLNNPTFNASWGRSFVRMLA